MKAGKIQNVYKHINALKVNDKVLNKQKRKERVHVFAKVWGKKGLTKHFISFINFEVNQDIQILFASKVNECFVYFTLAAVYEIKPLLFESGEPK